jgi:hypothetical protein
MQERRKNKIGRKNDENINERKKENRNIRLLCPSKMKRNVHCFLFFGGSNARCLVSRK